MYEIGKHHKTVRIDAEPDEVPRPHPHPQLDSDGDNPGWELGENEVPLFYDSLRSRAVFAVSAGSTRARWQTDAEERQRIEEDGYDHDWVQSA
jgi:hypothetical protein